MGKVFEAKLVGSGLKIGIVVGRFNEFINDKLLDGCFDGLMRHGVEEENIDVAWVPGAFEIPFIAIMMVSPEGPQMWLKRRHRYVSSLEEKIKTYYLDVLNNVV